MVWITRADVVTVSRSRDPASSTVDSVRTSYRFVPGAYANRASAAALGAPPPLVVGGGVVGAGVRAEGVVGSGVGAGAGFAPPPPHDAASIAMTTPTGAPRRPSLHWLALTLPIPR